MRATFTIADILAATRGSLAQAGSSSAFCGVSTDSRTCQTGELFIPLIGERHDGHHFIPKALHRGVRGVLVAQGFMAQPSPEVLRALTPEITVIAVADTLAALGDLARLWRSLFAVPVVGITGSCGKTTTKEMIATVLEGRFRVLKNRLNLNNLIGMPLTLLELTGAHDVAVVEMGMNAHGEIRCLTQIAAPTVGVLTNVHCAHTEGLCDIAGVARAKGELAWTLDREALLIYNADDPWLVRQTEDFRGPRLSFGLEEAADLTAQGRQTRGAWGQEARLHYQGRSWPLKLPAPGLHMLYNALAATAVGLALGLTPEETAAALHGFEAVHRRSQLVELPSGVHLLNDCYNANPGSMAMALRTLMEVRDGGRTAAALGDMLELGPAAVEQHRELGRRAAGLGLDLLVVYGSHRLEVAAGARESGLPAGRIFPVTHLTDAARILQELLSPGDWLLVKGSRSMHMEGLVDLLL